MARDFFFLLLLLLGGCFHSQAQSSDLELKSITVIDATGRPEQENVDVLIRDGRISKIAPHILARPHTMLIEAREKFLIPGLWDMHVHIWDADLALPLFVANGVTGVRNMGGHPEDLRRWRQEIAAGKRLNIRLVACGPLVDGPPPIHPDHSVVVRDAAEARAAVKDLQSQGWDFLKVYDNVPRAAYFAIAEEARKDHFRLVGHVPLSVTAIEASDAGQASFEHLEGLDYVISPLGEQFRLGRLERIGGPPEPGAMTKLPLRIANEINQLADTYNEKRAADLFAHLVRNGTWQVPTLIVKRVFGSIGNNAVYQDERLKYVAKQEREEWEHAPIVHIDIPEYATARRKAFQEALRITRSAHEAGVRFLAGTDAGFPYVYYGFSIHDELALLVEAGFTPLQALQAATRDPARFLGLDDAGTIEAGKRADMVLLDADPLKDIRNTQKIDAVILAGHFLDRRALDGLLSAAVNRAK